MYICYSTEYGVLYIVRIGRRVKLETARCVVVSMESLGACVERFAVNKIQRGNAVLRREHRPLMLAWPAARVPWAGRLPLTKPL